MEKSGKHLETMTQTWLPKKIRTYKAHGEDPQKGQRKVGWRNKVDINILPKPCEEDKRKIKLIVPINGLNNLVFIRVNKLKINRVVRVTG